MSAEWLGLAHQNFECFVAALVEYIIRAVFRSRICKDNVDPTHDNMVLVVSGCFLYALWAVPSVYITEGRFNC